MRRSWIRIALLVGALATPPVVSGAAADQISPLSSSRDVNLIVTVTDPSDWQSTGDQGSSEETGAFDFEADLPLSLGLAQAHGVAIQHSTVGGTGLEATGSLTSTASAELEGASSVIASNDYQVSFSLPSLSDFSLQGDLSAAGGGRCTFSFLGSGIEHSFVVEDGSQPIDLSGQLPAGQYFLFVNLAANVNVDLAEEASRAASASYDLDFSASPPVPNAPRSWGLLKSDFR